MFYFIHFFILFYFLIDVHNVHLTKKLDILLTQPGSSL